VVTTFFHDRPQRVDVQREVGDELLQSTIFVLECAQPPRLVDLEPAELCLPAVVGVAAHAVLPQQLGQRATRVALSQDRDDLLVTESASGHRTLQVATCRVSFQLDQFSGAGSTEPQAMRRVHASQPLTVPQNKNFVVTGITTNLKSTASGGEWSEARVYFDGVGVLKTVPLQATTNGAYIRAVPPGLRASAGTVVTCDDPSNPGQQIVAVLGYLADP
jgi:hypothetical protein